MTSWLADTPCCLRSMTSDVTSVSLSLSLGRLPAHPGRLKPKANPRATAEATATENTGRDALVSPALSYQSEAERIVCHRDRARQTGFGKGHAEAANEKVLSKTGGRELSLAASVWWWGQALVMMMPLLNDGGTMQPTSSRAAEYRVPQPYPHNRERERVVPPKKPTKSHQIL